MGPTKRKNNESNTVTKPRKIVKYYHDAQANKPDPIGKPEIWAHKRQQLCEALTFYKAYSSSIYTHNKIALGALIDKEVSLRDRFETEVIITSAGGGRSRGESGGMVRTKGQVTCLAFESYRNSKQRAIGVIAGKGNKLSPSKLPYNYNFLDLFHVTDTWCEVINGVALCKVRLEKVDLKKKSWWAAVPQNSSQSSKRAPKLFPPQIKVCITCGEESKEIFNAGWTCLEGICPDFFKFPNGYIPNDSGLDYSKAFMAERTAFEGDIPELSYPILTEESLKELGLFGHETAARHGIVCPDCKCCIRRRWWDKLECENEDCNFVLNVPRASITIDKLLESPDSDKKKKKKSLERCWGQIQKMESVCGAYKRTSYGIPNAEGKIIGSVFHFQVDEATNSEEGGPDNIFRDIQEGKLPLERNPVRQVGSIGEILTAHYATNWGAPYKYGVQQKSRPFAEAPDAVLKTVKRLTWAGKHSVPEDEFREFNECLSIAYSERGHMGYHDDGEDTLGETVASLSLGCAAVMKWRPKHTTDIKGPSLKGRKKEDVLRIVLKHGDIMMMHGSDIQKLYEHAVDPLGELRFVLTSRFIRPETLPTAEDQEFACNAGTFPESFHYEYDGCAKPAI